MRSIWNLKWLESGQYRAKSLRMQARGQKRTVGARSTGRDWKPRVRRPRRKRTGPSRMSVSPVLVSAYSSDETIDARSVRFAGRIGLSLGHRQRRSSVSRHRTVAGAAASRAHRGGPRLLPGSSPKKDRWSSDEKPPGEKVVYLGPDSRASDLPGSSPASGGKALRGATPHRGLKTNDTIRRGNPGWS